MKRILSIIIISALMVLIPTHRLDAQTSNLKTAEFKGTIESVRNFYTGEYANFHDFKVDGKFIDTTTKEEIPLYEWRIFPIKGINGEVTEIKIKHYSVEKSDSYYNDIIVNVNVKTEDFNPELHLQTYYIMHTTNSNLEEIINKRDYRFENSVGDIVLGEFIYDNKELTKGWNYINYTFTPYKVLETDYGYEVYNPKNGIIKIYFKG